MKKQTKKRKIVRTYWYLKSFIVLGVVLLFIYLGPMNVLGSMVSYAQQLATYLGAAK